MSLFLISGTVTFPLFVLTFCAPPFHLDVVLKPKRFLLFASLQALYSSLVILRFSVPGTTFKILLLAKRFCSSCCSIFFKFMTQVLSIFASKFLYSSTASFLFRRLSTASLTELALYEAARATSLVLSSSFSTFFSHLPFLAYFSSI